MQNKNAVILTISLLVSGREETTIKCLDSLVPLLREIPSELILVDTGCRPSFVDRLRKYTEQIIPFTWCNDFAKARNVGLTRAKGDWFMFADDDEWFDDVTPIVDFFKSGAYRNYHQAVYKVRNYRDASGKDYRDMWASRLIKRDADTHFEGKVHEELIPFFGKTAQIDCYAHHSGYIFSSEEQKKAHSHRNIPLLLEMLKEQPDNMRWPLHLLKEYEIAKEYDKMRQVAFDGMKKLETKEDILSNLQRGVFYTAVLMADRELEQYETLQNDFDIFIEDSRNSAYVKCSLYKLAALGAHFNQKYELADKYARLFFDAYDAYSNEPKDEQRRVLEASIIYIWDNVSDQIVDFMRALWATSLIFINRQNEYPEVHRRAFQKNLNEKLRSDNYRIPEYVKLMAQAGLISLEGTEKPILTISLLVSNRPENIKRCLDSLKPIMEKIPSELILVDTSKTKEIHDMLLEYTDQVLTFEWCNDFSKARNVGLEHAHGEWFLYLDDDEWFVETDELIDFFNSGEYREYHRANYIQRNFQDALLTYYSDFWASRMIRIEDDTHFESKIHEYLCPARGKCKYIKAVANHTGYIFQTEEDKLRHFERNSVLLLEMIKEEPKRLRWKVQMVQEYRGIKAWNDLYTFSMACLEETKAIDSPMGNRDIGTFYVGAVDGLMFQGRNDEAEAIANSGLSDKRMSKLCRSYLLLELGVIYFRKEQLDLSEKVLLDYLDNYDYMLQHEEEWREQQGVLLVEEAFDDVSVKKAYSILCCCGLKKKDTTYLKKYYEKLQWEKRVIYVCDDFPPVLLEAMSTMPLEEIFLSVWRDAWKNSELRRIFMEYIRKQKEQNQEAFYNLMRLVSEADTEAGFTLYADIVLAVFENDIERLDKSFTAKGRSFLEQILPDVLEQLEYGQLIALEEMYKESAFAYGTCRTLFRIQLKQSILKRNDTDIDYKELRASFAEFSNLTLNFLSGYYKQIIFEEYSELLPTYGQIAQILHRALQMEESDPIKALEAYREIVSIDQAYANVISSYMHMFGDHVSSEDKQAEMEELKEKVLLEVYEKIKKRQYADALVILSELKKVSPDDFDIAQMALRTRLLSLQSE